MSAGYLRRIVLAIDNVKRMIENFGEDYTVIIMADHGGRDRAHGTEIPEDMTISLFLCGKNFVPGEMRRAISLVDIAPTIAAVMGLSRDPDWEGVSLCNSYFRNCFKRQEKSLAESFQKTGDNAFLYCIFSAEMLVLNCREEEADT